MSQRASEEHSMINNFCTLKPLHNINLDSNMTTR